MNSGETFPNNARMINGNDLNLCEIVYRAFIYDIPASWFNLLNGYDFYFWWRNSPNQPYACLWRSELNKEIRDSCRLLTVSHFSGYWKVWTPLSWFSMNGRNIPYPLSRRQVLSPVFARHARTTTSTKQHAGNRPRQLHGKTKDRHVNW